MKINLKNLTLQQGIICLLTALFLTASVFLCMAENLIFTDQGIFSAIRTPEYLITLTLVFDFLFISAAFLPLARIRNLLMLASFMVYAVICMHQTQDTFFCLGACLILLPICHFTGNAGSAVRTHDMLSEHTTVPVFLHGSLSISAASTDITKATLTIISGIAITYFILLFGVQTVCRYLTLSTPCFDFGIFSQMFYSMSTSFLPVTTCEREMVLSHFAVHISPIYYLFLPFYSVFPSPITLEICQVAMLASGVIPLLLLTKELHLTNKSRAFFALLYVLYPSLGGGTYYDLHENKFLAPLLLWLLFFIHKNNTIAVIIFGLLVCFVKEDAPIYVMVIALYLLISPDMIQNENVRTEEFKARFINKTEIKKRDIKKRPVRSQSVNALLLLGLSTLYFILAIFLLRTYGQGVMSWRYSNFMAPEDSTLTSVVINIFKNPAYVIYEIFTTNGATADISKLTFFLQMLLPLGFLPLMIKRYDRILLLIPFILVNLMPDYTYQHSIFFQYTYGSFPLLLYAATLNYRDINTKAKRVIGLFTLCASILLCTQTVYARARYYTDYLAEKENYDEIRHLLEGLPEEASASASTFFCAALSKRAELYSLDNSEQEHETDYIAVDLRYSSNQEYYEQYREDNRYEMLYFKAGYLALFQRQLKITEN